MKKTALVFIPALAVILSLAPVLSYLGKYPNPVYESAVLGHPAGMPRETYEIMKISAELMAQESKPEDVWIVPERLGWNNNEAHPFVGIWSSRRALGDGKHLFHFLRRLEAAQEELTRRKSSGQILVLSSSHVTEVDILDYLKRHGQLLKDHSTVYGNMKVYGISAPPTPGQFG